LLAVFVVTFDNITLLLILMNNYLEARQWLRNDIGFEMFEEKLPGELKDAGLLSLLVGAVMDVGL